MLTLTPRITTSEEVAAEAGMLQWCHTLLLLLLLVCTRTL